jgi:hypothetical protein
MNMHERFAPSKLVEAITAPSQRHRFGLLIGKLAAWPKDRADHYAIAAAYEHLSGLSDRELRHCGLSRDILSRDLSGSAQRPAGRKQRH